jgi:PAS domain S-box-containing protein
MKTLDKPRIDGWRLPSPSRARTRRGRSEGRWQSLVRNAPDFILCIDRTNRIEFINRTVPPWRPRDVVGTTVWRYLPKGSHHRFRAALQRVFRDGVPQQLELSGFGRSRSEAWYVSRLGPIRDGGRIVGAILISSDITDRKRAEDALRGSEAKFRAVFEKGWDAIFMVDLKGRVLDANPAACRSLGYTRSELLKRKVADFAVEPPESLRDRFRTIARGAPRTFESVHRRKDGSTFPVEVHAGSFELGGRRVVLGLVRDISHRKRAEEAELVSRAVIRAQEAERRRVSRELHDSVGQLLSSVKLRVQACASKLPQSEPSLVAEAARVLELLDEAIAEVRDISRNLRPSTLDDLGLTAAVRSLCSEFQERTRLRVRARFPRSLRRLSRETEINLYRILQEALSNVERHARAGRVDVELVCGAAELRLRIRDDGAGMPARGRGPARTRGAGLVNMRERAGQIGGSLTVQAPRGGGTEILVRVPAGGHRS